MEGQPSVNEYMDSDCTGGRIAMQFDTASQNKKERIQS